MSRTLPLLAALCLLCATPGLAHGSFVYVTNYGDGTISQFRANPNGTLMPLNPPCVKAYPRCHSLATDPKGRFLYALSGLEFSHRNCLISEFRIGSDGRLSPFSLPAMSTPQNMASPYQIFIEPRGHYLYVLDHAGQFAQFRIKRNGSLAPLNPVVADVRLHGNLHFSLAYDQIHSVFHAISETRMTNMYLAWKSAFRIAQNGQLCSVRTLSFRKQYSGNDRYNDQNGYVRQVVTARQGRNVYFLYDWLAPIGNGNVPVIVQYRTQSNLGLVPLKPAEQFFPTRPTEVFVDPFSHYFYALSLEPSTHKNTVITGSVVVERYSILTDGSLGRKSQQVLIASGGLFSPVFNSSGRFLYLLTGNGVRPFRVGHDGSVAPLTASSIHFGRGPLGMVFVRR